MDNKEPQLRQELKDLKKKLEDPAVFSSKDFPKLAKRQSELEAIMELYDKKIELENTKKFAVDHLNDSDPEMAELASRELEYYCPPL